MIEDDFSAEDANEFNQALKFRDAGKSEVAIAILERLAKRKPRKASVLGMLAGIQYGAGNFADAARNARRVTELSTKSELASTILFLSLFHLGDATGAFREAARFRSLKESVEYERILMDLERDTLRDLQGKPNDPLLSELMSRIREELRARPVRQ